MPSAGVRGFSRVIRSRQRLVHMVHADVDGTGTAALNSGSQELTLTDNGVGDYNLAFAIKPQRVLSVQVSSKTADSVLQVAAVSTTTMQILGFDATDGTTAKDVDFYISVAVSDSADEV